MECGGHQDCSSIGQNPRYGGLFSPPSDLRWTGDSQRPQTIFGSQDHSPPDSAAPSHHPPLNPELFHGTRGLQPSHSLLTWHPPPHSNSLPTSQEAMPSTLMNEMAHAQWASPVLTSCTPDCLQYFDPAQTVCPFHAMNNDDQIAYFNMYASRVSTPAPPAHHGDSGATDKEPESSSEPYAVLIYKALKSAPGHRMVLKDIYEWFENNTDKNNGPSKGWQNSIRHNLSMNGAFQKVEQDILNTDGRRGYIWVLDPAAIAAGGVESTTRYRKVGPVKKTVESDVLAAPRRSTHKVRKASLGKRAPAHAYNSHSLRHSLERAMSSVSLDDNQMEIDSSPVATTRGNLSTYEALVQAQSNLNHHHYHNQWFNTQTYFQQPGYGCGQDDTMTEPHLVSGYAASPSSATIPSPGVSPELSQAAPTLKQEYNFEDIEGCTPGYEIADLYFPSHELPDANSPYIPVGLESHYRNHGGL